MQQFDNRKDLSLCEKMALMCYRDIGYPQHIWEIDIEGVRENIDCDVMNGYLRGKIPKSKFTKLKLKYLSYLITTITRIIDKSRVDRKLFTVYKGVSYYPELENYTVDNSVTDLAFNSFSTSENRAFKYSGKNSKGQKIILALDLKRGDKAVYIDNKEHEWLVQRGSHYAVTDVREYSNYKSRGKAIVYYLRLT